MDRLRQLFGGKKAEGRKESGQPPVVAGATAVPVKAAPAEPLTSGYCRSCHAAITVPRTTPKLGTALICPACKAPFQRVHEDPAGSPVGWTPQQARLILGYTACSIEHPRCPRCGKTVYAVVFPERGRDVPWYAVEKQQDPMANFTMQVDCPNCSQPFTVEWEGWPFPFDSHKQCNFCGLVVSGDTNPQGIPEDKRAQFEADLGGGAVKNAYLVGSDGKPLWYACPLCIRNVIQVRQRKEGTDLAKAYSLGPEWDRFVDELLAIDRAAGLMMGDGEPDASLFDENRRHRRGREIGEMLASQGGNGLMVKVATAFVNRGGTEWRVSHCWHNIKDGSGHVCWMA